MIEKEILSSALLSQDKLYTVLEYENIFTEPNCRRLRDVMESLVSDGHGVDSLSVVALCPTLDKFVAELMTLPTVYNIEYAMSTLHKAHVKRRLKDVARDISNSDGQMDELISALVDEHDKLNANKKDYCLVSELASKELSEIFKESRYVKTRVEEIDEVITGLFCGQLVIIAGRPKKGKSALALQIAMNIEDCLLFSLEMPRTELFARLLSMKASVEAWKIEARKLDEDEYSRVLKAKSTYEKSTLLFYDNGIPCQTMLNTIKKYCERKKPTVIIIDYLQLIRGGKGENQNLRIAYITGSLKALAMKYNIPIVLLSQLSRDSEKQGRKPVLADLRDSGAIEQDADVVIFVHEEGEVVPKTEIIVAANRKGKTGIIPGLRFEKRFTRFEPIYQSTRFEDGVMA